MSKPEYSIEHTYFSDGVRKIIIIYKSKEGERVVLNDIKKLLDDYVKHYND